MVDVDVASTLEVLFVERGLSKAGKTDEQDEFLCCCRWEQGTRCWENERDWKSVRQSLLLNKKRGRTIWKGGNVETGQLEGWVRFQAQKIFLGSLMRDSRSSQETRRVTSGVRNLRPTLMAHFLSVLEKSFFVLEYIRPAASPTKNDCSLSFVCSVSVENCTGREEN